MSSFNEADFKTKNSCQIEYYIIVYLYRAVSSVVERLPYKQVVIGSNPIPPMYLNFKIA